MIRSVSPRPAPAVRPARIALVALVLAPVFGLVPAAFTAGSSTAPNGSIGRFSLSGEHVHIYNLAGKLELLAGSGSSVQIEMTKRGRDGHRLGAQTPAGDGEPALIVQYPEDRIVCTDLPRGMRTNFRVAPDGRFGDQKSGWLTRSREIEIRSSGDGLEAWADLKVRVPKGQRIAVHLGAGEASVTNVDGELLVDCAAAGVTATGTRGKLIVDTGSGAVVLSDVEGPLSVDTGSGSVDATLVRGPSVRVDTGSGSVSLSRVTADEISVDTGSGSVELSDARSPLVHVDTGSGWVRMGLLATVEEVFVDTGSGSVEITAPADLSATVDLETGSGDLESDFPLRVSRRGDDRITGTIGEGKGRIAIETGSGSVHLRKF